MKVKSFRNNGGVPSNTKIPHPQRLLRPRVKRCFTKSWLNGIKHESLLRWSTMIQPSSTVIKIWTFLSSKVYIWRIYTEITRERGQEKKGRAVKSWPFFAARSWDFSQSKNDTEIISLSLDRRNGDLACWPKHFFIRPLIRYWFSDSEFKKAKTNKPTLISFRFKLLTKIRKGS